ncbi:MAG: class I SAM-dependent methyltransferase [Myxococcales bacterium]|nr:class I SAM-dependent methyltransferase [Myxococcales bacterium]
MAHKPTKGDPGRFDRRYYQRFYRDPATRVTTPREIERLANFVDAYLRYLQLPVKRVLDAGCGLGYWHRALAKLRPQARYTGIELSPYLCQRYGWIKASVVDYRPRGRFDLVICQGVLQYLDAQQASAAIENLAGLCRGVLYLEVLTAEDWAEHCDRGASDGDVHRRPAAFYRRRLGKHFRCLGGGLWLNREAPTVLYTLETAD